MIEIEKPISIYHNHGICISCETKEEINIRYRLRCHEMKSESNNTNSQNNITQQSKPRSQMLSWTGHGCYPLQSDPRWWHFCTDCGLQSKKKWSATMHLDLKRFLHLRVVSSHSVRTLSLQGKNSIGGLLPKRIVRSQDSLLQLQPNHPNHSNLHLKQAIDNSLYHESRVGKSWILEMRWHNDSGEQHVPCWNAGRVWPPYWPWTGLT